LRLAFKAAVVLSVRVKGSMPEIAYQLMNIVEARGITDPDRIMSNI
jgi:hypothetical protein